MKKISIAIPAYEMRGEGVRVLDHSFQQMAKQTFKNFDVVVSDHSRDDFILNLCDLWKESGVLDIKYFRNEEGRGLASPNTNNSIEKSTGEWIKLLCQDDYLYDEYSLETIADHLDDRFVWMATAYWHTTDKKHFERKHYPSLNDWLLVTNTIGTPSCVVVKNTKNLPKIDENLTYAYDCEWYWRLWKQYGIPKLIDQETIVNYLWDNSVSSRITPELITKENEYILRKHGFIQYE